MASQSLPMNMHDEEHYDRPKKRAVDILKLRLGNITEPLRLSLNEATASSLKSIRKWTNPNSQHSPSFEANSVGSNSDSESGSTETLELDPLERERNMDPVRERLHHHPVHGNNYNHHQ